MSAIEKIRALKSETPPRFIPDNMMPKRTKKAAAMIAAAVRRGDTILVAGDYDLDGITATTILFAFLRKAGAYVEYKIPSRLKDGYGISPNMVKHAKSIKADMIITVDNGISAVDAVEMAKEAGMKVIITDHHTPPPNLPNADVIVNPKVDGSTKELPFYDISGATVAWFLIRELEKKLEMTHKFSQGCMDYVGITVISDVMPVKDINLVFLNKALESARGLKREIFKYFWNDFTAPVIDTESFGFGYVPYLNAIGRLGDANYAVEMMLTSDHAVLKHLYEYSANINNLSKQLKFEYKTQAFKELGDGKRKVVVYKNDSFHEGIVGIIAGQLAEKYGCPAFCLTYNKEKKVWKGSGRSAGQIDLYQLTLNAKDHLLGFGGHKGAVGLAVSEDRFDQFKQSIEEAAEKIPDDMYIDPAIEPIEADFKEITDDLLDAVELIGPFGLGNPEPKFKVKARLKETKLLKKEHAKATIYEENKELPGLFFFIDQERFVKIADQKREVSLIVKGMRKFNPKTKQKSWELNAKLAEE